LSMVMWLSHAVPSCTTRIFCGCESRTGFLIFCGVGLFVVLRYGRISKPSFQEQIRCTQISIHSSTYWLFQTPSLSTLLVTPFRMERNHVRNVCTVCFCLLLIDKLRDTDKTYIWVSVWWKTKT
jgi:hypothetical protein